MPPEPRQDWKRLARLLAERRVEIAPRYQNKHLFCEERGLNRRMLWRIETGDDDNYSHSKIGEIEDAYGLVRGSLLRTVAGGGLEPLPEPGAGAPLPPEASAALASSGQNPAEDSDEQLLAAIIALARMTGTPPADRIEMIQGLLKRARPEPGSGTGRRIRTG